MALNRIIAVSYVIDILYYTVIDDNWGIGKLICKYRDKLIAYTGVLCAGFYCFNLNDYQLS